MDTGDGLTTDDDKQTVVSLLTLFGKTALQGGALYSSHAKRRGITPEDLKRALMLEVFVYSKQPGILEQVDAIKKDLVFRQEGGKESGDGGDAYTEQQPFEESGCECALCRCFNTICERWGQWKPQSPIEIILKNHVDSI